MRTRYFSLSLLIFVALTLIVACAPTQTVALLPSQLTVMPGWQYVATATPAIRLVPCQGSYFQCLALQWLMSLEHEQ